MPYAELRAASAFSFLEAASAPEHLARTAASLGIGAVALTDLHGVYGSARLETAAREAGVRAIVGASLRLDEGGVLPVLVETLEGYRNLCRLLTAAHLRTARTLPAGRSSQDFGYTGTPAAAPLVSIAELAAYSAGLCALDGWRDGPLHAAWSRGGAAAAQGTLEGLLRCFPADRLLVEQQRHHHRSDEAWNRVARDIAASANLTLVATNGVLHATPAERAVLDVLSCMRQRTHLDAAGRLLAANSERHLKDERAMRALFPDLPGCVDAAGRAAERLPFCLRDLGYEFPRHPVPPGETMDSHLAKLTWFGAAQRYGSLTEPVRRQIRHELDLIARLGFSGYFLVVWDIVTFAREQGILVQGRGSAANSAVCYSLGITAVDPVGQNLLFERFLSEGRTGWPDIDLDLPSGDARERVIQEVYRRHGPHGAGMTANVITFRGRSAARELTAALNLPAGLADRFSSLFAGGDYPHTLELREHLHQAGLPRTHPRSQAFAELYIALRGLPRHLGQHSGGMVICQGALDGVVPLQPASMPGRVVVQWDKDDCEDLGIVKVDFLGLGMMAVLQDCVELSRERGRPVDLAHIPKDDTATYDMLCRADTIGTFQVESRAQQATLPRLQPRCFYDVVIEVALIRPGPVQGKLVNPYLERRAGRQPVTYADPALEPILGRTLGIALFQEQVLKIAMVLAGFTASEAEDLRRALGFHRNNERMDRALARLHEKLTARGYGPEVVEDLSRQIRSFALYGFPESHAISFALIAYASCWLKLHRPAEFLAALLNNQPMGFYSPATLVQDARRHGVRVRPPCLRASLWACTVEDDRTVRLGLGQVRGLREAPVRAAKERLRAEPTRTQPPLHLFSRTERRALAASGALNAFYPHRRAALWAVEDLLIAADTAQGELDLTDAADGGVTLAPMDLTERVDSDYAATGLTTGAHPMALLRPNLPDDWCASELVLAQTGERVRVSGAVICRQRPGTAKGVVFLSLEDETGIANVICHAPFFEAHRLVIVSEPFLTVTGKAQVERGVIHVIAEDVRRLDTGAAHPPAQASHDFR